MAIDTSSDAVNSACAHLGNFFAGDTLDKHDEGGADAARLLLRALAAERDALQAKVDASVSKTVMGSQDDWVVHDCPHCHKCVTYSRKEAASLVVYRDASKLIDALQADNAKLLAEMRANPDDYPNLLRINREHAAHCERLHDAALAEVAKLRAEVEGKQSRIDSLMLEYCPDEMTPEQMENWAKNQRRVSPEEAAKINAALTSMGGDAK